MKKRKRSYLKGIALFFINMIVLSIFSQNITVSGNVTDDTGETVIGATVIVVGDANNGTVTDIDGNYTLSGVSSDGSLQVSFVGMSAQVVHVNGRSMITVLMTSDAELLDEVVITALGIERDKKSLGYSMQEVGGTDLVDAREANIANALSGKVSGLQIVRGAGGPSGSSKIVLRGNNSLTGDNQPLIVIDGMPMDNFTDGADVDMWGTGDGRDFGSGIGDLNADDIESMSVLKGASAASLYGSRAGNGVILITTKKGGESKGAGITVNSSIGFESILAKPELQDAFAQGSYGNYNRLSRFSWGPKIEGQMVEDWRREQSPLQSYDNVGNYFNTGIVSNHNIAFSKLINKTAVFASITRYDNKSIVPHTDINRSTFTVRANSVLDKQERFKIDTKVSYVNSNAENRPMGGIEAQNNSFYTLWTLPRNLDIRDFNPSIDDDGNQLWWDDQTAQGNPWWSIQYGKNFDSRDRFMGFMSLSYDIAEWLNAEVKGGTDYYTTKKEVKIHTGGILRPEGNYSKSITEAFENNFSFLIKARQDNLIDKLGGDFTLGGNIMHQKNDGMGGNSGALVVPNLFSLNNGEDKPDVWQSYSEKKINSLYGALQLNWDGYIFIDATLRNDWSSTMHKDNRSFLYPSISFSSVVTDMISNNGGSLPDFLTFAKVRASYAEVGNDLAPYQLYNSYWIGKADSPHDQTTAGSNSVMYDPFVVNELIKSYEAGVDFRFLDNRLGLDFTWYRTNAINQLIDLPMDPFSGYKDKKINAGNIQNEGIEVMFKADIFRNNNGFNWTFNANMSKNKNSLIELAEGIEEYSLGNVDDLKIVAMAGGRYGEIYGKKMLRVEDEDSPHFGEVIVDDGGLPLKGNNWEYLGNQQPDWMLGINNMFSYKNLTLNFLLDMKFGGKIFSGTTVYNHTFGVAKETVVDGERAEFVVDGVLHNEDGTYSKNTEAVSPQDYWTRVAATGNLGITDEFTYDASSIRLRNIKLGYKLPSSWFNNAPINGIDVSLIGNNVWLIHSNVPGIDPESVMGVATNAIGMEMGSPPTLRSFTFNVSLKF